jgi:hypothetical protein
MSAELIRPIAGHGKYHFDWSQQMILREYAFLLLEQSTIIAQTIN